MLKRSFQSEALCRWAALCDAWTASSVAHVASGYASSLRPFHAPPIAPHRRSVTLE